MGVGMLTGTVLEPVISRTTIYQELLGSIEVGSASPLKTDLDKMKICSRSHT